MNEIEGNLIDIAIDTTDFDLIAHGCNCFNTMGAGIAKEIKERLTDAYKADQRTTKGDINKLGNYTLAECFISSITGGFSWAVTVLNLYTQYGYSRDEKPFDYDAFTLCLRKINHNFKGKHIGLPLIGAGLAGGDWDKIKQIIETELKDMEITIVHFKP